MKALVVLIFVAATLGATPSAPAQGAEVRYTYDEREFTWDKRQLDTPPLPVGGQQALTRYLAYPRALRRQRIQGESAVSVSVDSAGRVTSVTFAPCMHRDLESIVRSAVLRSRWKPGKKDGAARAGTFPANFRISAE
jgi:TonB family protein